MFSRALFKQSCKANGIMWGIITFAVCFMLACVMIIMGNGNATAMKSGISDSLIGNAIDSSMKERALNYYELCQGGLETFDGAYLMAKLSDKNEQESYLAGVQAVNIYIDAVVEKLGFEQESVEAQEISGLVMCVLNPNGQFNTFYSTFNEQVPVYTMPSVLNTTRQKYVQSYVKTNASIFLAGNMISEANIEKILDQLKSFNVDAQKYAELGFSGINGYNNIKNLSVDAMITYQARYDERIAKIDNTLSDEQKQLEIQTIKQDLTKDITGSFISHLPEDIAQALTELGEMNLFSLIIGSIFFKMAGLLLPIIFMIMAANNLIAGQVDSGSMAYLLSTSTKRKKIVFTQALYLVSSLFVMFCLTTITSVACLCFLDRAALDISFADVILLNVGAFITMFCMSGISFLASCWFNRSKHSMSIGGGVNMFFLVASMLGLFGSKTLPSVVRLKALNAFNYVSIISLFDVDQIFVGNLNFIWKLAILAVVGVVCYFVGSLKFQKKDLPL